MFNKPDDYVFGKIKGKLDLVQQNLEKTSEVCKFSEGQEFSTDTITALKKDVAAQLRKAAEQLEEAIMFAAPCNSMTDQEKSS